MSDRPTKERILDAAEAIMLERSFHSVGLNQILKAVKVPKGSFYHYFDSKEQFGVELLKHYSAASNSHKRQALLSEDPEANPLDRLHTFFQSVIDAFQENGGKCPCLILKLASEVADFSEPMREALAEGVADSISIIKNVLDEAVEKQLLPASFNTTSEAAHYHDLWTGAAQRATITRSPAPIEKAIAYIRSRLTP